MNDMLNEISLLRRETIQYQVKVDGKPLLEATNEIITRVIRVFKTTKKRAATQEQQLSQLGSTKDQSDRRRQNSRQETVAKLEREAAELVALITPDNSIVSNSGISSTREQSLTSLQDEARVEDATQETDGTAPDFAFLTGTGVGVKDGDTTTGPQQMVEVVESWKLTWRKRFGSSEDGVAGSLKLTIERNGAHECQSNPATACAGCVKRKTPCIIASDVLALPVVLPLPKRHREGFGRQDPGF
ncbi:hypothetical protein VE04_02712 [Pseudogymnoascus sp. 24MN13]|nr:hypothetical protein VE04_02712 [Pseudogymnoascus sp. 24MN13]